MGEDDVSYHFRVETDFSFNTLILYKKILRYERNIFYPDSVNLKKLITAIAMNQTVFLLL